MLATVFSHNIGLGCTRNAALIEKVARIDEETLRRIHLPGYISAIEAGYHAVL